MVHTVIILYRGTLAHYAFEKVHPRSYQLHLTEYTGHPESGPPPMLNLCYTRSGAWQGDTGDSALWQDVGTGLFEMGIRS